MVRLHQIISAINIFICIIIFIIKITKIFRNMYNVCFKKQPASPSFIVRPIGPILYIYLKSTGAIISWRDAIVTMHGEILSITLGKLLEMFSEIASSHTGHLTEHFSDFTQGVTIHGEMLLSLSMARCYYHYPRRDVIITIHGAMLLSLSMARCYYYYPWRDVIHGEMLLSLSMARCYYTYPGMWI